MSVQLNRHLISVAAYHLLGREGMLSTADKVELIRGEIVYMSPIGSMHALLVDALAHALISGLGNKFYVRVQNPIRLSDVSEPEPDIALVHLPRKTFLDRHPIGKEVSLVIEVADSSLSVDREIKLPLYAEANVQKYWIVDLQHEKVEIYQQPEGGHYASKSYSEFADTIIDSELGIKLRIQDFLE
ncbi:MAG: Uma2 family endonuclease [Bacteroidota bacterium]